MPVLDVCKELDRIVFQFDTEGYAQHHLVGYAEVLILKAKGRNQVQVRERICDVHLKQGSFEAIVTNSKGVRTVYRFNFDFKLGTFSVHRHVEAPPTKTGYKLKLTECDRVGKSTVVYHKFHDIAHMDVINIHDLARQDLDRLLPDPDAPVKNKRGSYKTKKTPSRERLEVFV